MNIEFKIYELFESGLSIDEIVDSLTEVQLNKIELKKLVHTFLSHMKSELEADAYLSSLECYYDNYCEY